MLQMMTHIPVVENAGVQQRKFGVESSQSEPESAGDPAMEVRFTPGKTKREKRD